MRNEDEVPYAEGVTLQSPGSRRGEAAERTLGHATHHTRIRRRRYTNEDHDDAMPTRSPNGTTTLRLCNAFGVRDVRGERSPRVRRERRPRRIAATLGSGIQPLRGKEPMGRRVSHAESVPRNNRESHCGGPYAEGAT